MGYLTNNKTLYSLSLLGNPGAVITSYQAMCDVFLYNLTLKEVFVDYSSLDQGKMEYVVKTALLNPSICQVYIFYCCYLLLDENYF